MLGCIPVQLFVVASRLVAALTGRRAAVDDLRNLDDFGSDGA